MALKISSFSLCFVLLLAISTGVGYASIQSGDVVACWLLDEGTGNIAYDSSGNGYDGTITGGAWVDGQFGKAIHFESADPGSGWIEIPGDEAFNLRWIYYYPPCADRCPAARLRRDTEVE